MHHAAGRDILASANTLIILLGISINARHGNEIFNVRRNHPSMLDRRVDDSLEMSTNNNDDTDAMRKTNPITSPSASVRDMDER